MDTRKLDRWADLLHDTGKRNNLVNFRGTRASTVEIVALDVCTIFEKADGAAAFEVFDPKFAEEDFDELVGQDTATEEGSKKQIRFLLSGAVVVPGQDRGRYAEVEWSVRGL